MDKQEERFLRIQEVMGKTGLGRSTIWDFINKDKFPKPIKLSSRITVWLLSEVDDYMKDIIGRRGRNDN